MKKLFFIAAAFMLFGFTMKAQNIITVDNNAGSNAMYSNLQTAIDDATAGDTILVAGSTTSYGSVTIQKQLTLVGAGYHPNNQLKVKTQLSDITLSENLTNNPSGTTITGFYCNRLYADNNIDNIVVSRNEIITELQFQGSGCNDWLITNNLLDGIRDAGAGNPVNIIITNNIIEGNIEYFDQPSVTFTNNIFTNSNPDYVAFNSVEYATISNNIFYGIQPGVDVNDCNYCTFTNNISYGGTSTSFNFAENSASNNIEATDPQFENVSSFSYDYSYDYHLQATSPGKNAGSDGTDIGIYGGSSPFPSGGDSPYQTSPFPDYPQLLQMNIHNAVIPIDGTLEVDVQAKGQN